MNSRSRKSETGCQVRRALSSRYATQPKTETELRPNAMLDSHQSATNPEICMDTGGPTGTEPGTNGL
jgi:hypothetical protein